MNIDADRLLPIYLCGSKQHASLDDKDYRTKMRNNYGLN
jgi:hypothetical protein